MPSSHERYDGPLHVVGDVREGWAFNCECGYRSPLFRAREDAIEGMRVHRAAPPTPPKKPGLFSRKSKWPGWPNERRRRRLS